MEWEQLLAICGRAYAWTGVVTKCTALWDCFETLPLLPLANTRLGGELGRNSLKQSQSAIHHHRPRRKRNLRLVISRIILYLTYVFNEFNSFIVSSSFLAPSVLINMCESVKACTAKDWCYFLHTPVVKKVDNAIHWTAKLVSLIIIR